LVGSIQSTPDLSGIEFDDNLIALGVTGVVALPRCEGSRRVHDRTCRDASGHADERTVPPWAM
jgi:hypothetical protein